MDEYFGTVDTGDKNPFQLTTAQVDELADTGKVAALPGFKDGFPAVTPAVCPQLDWTQDPKTWQSFGPPGPRGWQDEYCEWTVTRNAQGKIIQVDFTCENPEYWFILWQADPEVVLREYRAVVSPKVELADLYLKNAKGEPVKNPITGQYAYDPLNKWNSGPNAGAMHLTSPPNTVGAEVYLAAAATLVRPDASEANAPSLICCSNYGQPYRNSDPHIGFTANQFVYQNGQMLTLANPIGLYLQTPDFSQYTLPANAPASVKPSDFWQVTRGRLAAAAGTSYDQVLHATYRVPPDLGFTVSDIAIGGQAIQWGSQITRTITMALAAIALPAATRPAQLPCPTQAPVPVNLWPQLLMDDTLLNAYLRSPEGIPPMPPPALHLGRSYSNITLFCANYLYDPKSHPEISFPGGGITATVTKTYYPPKDGPTISNPTVVQGKSSTWTSTLSGTPNDALEVVIEFSVGGTTGSSSPDITYTVSTDVGNTFGSPLMLGTATSITVGGVSIALGSSSFVTAGDSVAWSAAPASATAFVLDLTVAPDAAPGLHSILVTQRGITAPPPSPAILSVVAPAILGAAAPARRAARPSRALFTRSRGR